MRPLNYALLKYVASVPKASAYDAVAALREQYGRFRMLNLRAVLETLMTAEQNSLLEEVGYELDDNQEIRLYFRVTEYGAEMIERYIK